MGPGPLYRRTESPHPGIQDGGDLRGSIRRWYLLTGWRGPRPAERLAAALGMGSRAAGICWMGQELPTMFMNREGHSLTRAGFPALRLPLLCPCQAWILCRYGWSCLILLF